MGQPKRGGSWNEGSAVTCRRQEKGGLVVCQVAAAAAAAEEKEEEASTAAVAAGKQNENAKNARNPEGSLTATSFQWSLSLSLSFFSLSKNKIPDRHFGVKAGQHTLPCISHDAQTRSNRKRQRAKTERQKDAHRPTTAYGGWRETRPRVKIFERK